MKWFSKQNLENASLVLGMTRKKGGPLAVLVHDKMYLSISNYDSYFQWKIENFMHFNSTVNFF